MTFLLSPLPKLGQSSDVKNDKKENKTTIKDGDAVKKVKGDPKKEFKFPEGCVSHTDSKKPICRNFNLGRCKFAVLEKDANMGCTYVGGKGATGPKGVMNALIVDYISILLADPVRFHPKMNQPASSVQWCRRQFFSKRLLIPRGKGCLFFGKSSQVVQSFLYACNVKIFKCCPSIMMDPNINL